MLAKANTSVWASLSSQASASRCSVRARPRVASACFSSVRMPSSRTASSSRRSPCGRFRAAIDRAERDGHLGVLARGAERQARRADRRASPRAPSPAFTADAMAPPAGSTHASDPATWQGASSTQPAPGAGCVADERPASRAAMDLREIVAELGRSTDTFGRFIRQQAERIPDRVALKFEAETVTYGAYDARVNRLAAVLARAGLRPGEPVADPLSQQPALPDRARRRREARRRSARSSTRT